MQLILSACHLHKKVTVLCVDLSIVHNKERRCGFVYLILKPEEGFPRGSIKKAHHGECDPTYPLIKECTTNRLSPRGPRMRPTHSIALLRHLYQKKTTI